MKEMQVTLFNSKGEFFQSDIISEQNFEEQVAFVGALLSGGWTVKIDDITYTLNKLPEYFAYMHRLKDISNVYDYFMPYLTYIQQVRYVQVGEFLGKNQEFQKMINKAFDSVSHLTPQAETNDN